MANLAVENELNIPRKYTKSSTRENRVEAIVNKTWLKQLLKSKKIPEFILHDKLSDDETSSLFKQGEHFSPEWQKIIISVLAKKESLVIPLPRVRTGSKPGMKLSSSQILQYVSHTNYKNLWKEAFKKYNGEMFKKEDCDDSSVQLMDQCSLLKEIIARTYGAPIIRDGHVVYDAAYRPHSNLFKASVVVETNCHFFIIHESHCDFTLLDCVTFSPAILSGSYARPLFILYQLLRLMRHLHDLGLVLGSITLADIYISQDLWIQVLPKLEDNVHDSPEQKLTDAEKNEGSIKKGIEEDSTFSSPDIFNLTKGWVIGAVSNFDYLCELNRLAGRRYGDPRSHYVLPWVSDFSSRSGANWRDLTKSKFRLNKGDRQLDLTYELPPSANSAQIRHHVPDVLSEITYYVYLSRITPKTILCKYVRPQWVPGEYPASIQRLQAWTPDECIPEFFTDPSVFKSIHNDLGDLEVPPWCSSPQDFISSHRGLLESPAVSEKLHHWIDLTFGYKLSGSAAVKAKNVCLQLVDGHKKLCGSGVVQLFTFPHPQRARPSIYLRKTPPRIHQPRRKSSAEEEEGQSSGLDEEEPINASPLLFSRFMSRSRTSLIHSPLNQALSPGSSDNERSATIVLPKDYNPIEALTYVESLHGFVGNNGFRKEDNAIHEVKHSEKCRQILAATRATEMQNLGCILVELFLAQELRVYGNGLKPTSHTERLKIVRSVLSSAPADTVPKCVLPLIKLLVQDRENVITESGSPTPSAHQLLQPLLAPLHFPRQFPLLYSSLEALLSYSTALSDLSSDDDLLLLYKVAEMKVKNLSVKIEELVESEICLDILLPYIIDMLSSPLTDVLAAWYLFDHVARALGPKRCRQHLLEVMVHLYDWERPHEVKLLQKRVKLYHRSFLVRLIVRFGLSTFLEIFIPILCEAVGGYHDLDQHPYSHLNCGDVEEAVEVDSSMPLSPLDEDSSADSEKSSSIHKEPVHVEIFDLEEDTPEDAPKIGPKSAISLQNLLIDNPESEEKEGEEHIYISESSWRRKSYNILKQAHFEQETPDVEYSKVCEVSDESLAWLAHRLGPVLTSVHIGRSLLRLLGLAYTGSTQLAALDYDLAGDSTTTHLLHSLTSISGLFGDQVIRVQYLPHVVDLVSHCKRKLTPPLEGALIGSIVLLAHVIPLLNETTFSDILQDTLISDIIDPCLRLIGSRGLLFPSGACGRRALCLKIHSLLITLTRQATPTQRLTVLLILQRFFLIFSKAYSEREPDLVQDLDSEQKSSDSGVSQRATNISPESSLKAQALTELREALSPEFAYLAYTPFGDFFGENVMEQTLRNYELINQLTSEYMSENEANIAKQCEIEPSEIRVSDDIPLTPVGSFGNVIVVGNRIEIQQDPPPKSVSPGGEEASVKSSKRSENMNRHLHGNWLAYWEHELGRNKKDSGLNIKQIKLQTFSGHTNTVKHIVPLGSENSFMSASRDKTVRLWSLRSQGDGSHVSHAQWSYSGHRKSVLSLAWVERTRLTASSDATLHLWDPFVGRLLSVVDGGRSIVNTIRSCREPSAEVLCATTDPTLRSLDTRVGGFVRELKISQSGGSPVRCMVVSPNSKWVAVGQDTGHLTVIDMTMGSILSAWKAHEAEVLQLIAVDEHTIISSALDQAVSVWNVNDGKLLYNLKGTTEPVHCLELYGNELVWGTTANRLGVHSSIEPSATFSSTKLRTDSLKGVLTSIALLPLNRLLLLGADSGTITLLC